ncbi:MAG: hypothetical protein V7K50_17565 [Nostoc sp.]
MKKLRENTGGHKSLRVENDKTVSTNGNTPWSNGDRLLYETLREGGTVS